METFSALLAICEGNPPVIGGFPSQMPVTRRFDIYFDLRLNKRLSKQSRRQWFETPSRSLRRHCKAIFSYFQVAWRTLRPAIWTNMTRTRPRQTLQSTSKHIYIYSHRESGCQRGPRWHAILTIAMEWFSVRCRGTKQTYGEPLLLRLAYVCCKIQYGIQVPKKHPLFNNRVLFPLALICHYLIIDQHDIFGPCKYHYRARVWCFWWLLWLRNALCCSRLSQVIACCLLGTKPLPEQVLTLLSNLF